VRRHFALVNGAQETEVKRPEGCITLFSDSFCRKERTQASCVVNRLLPHEPALVLAVDLFQGEATPANVKLPAKRLLYRTQPDRRVVNERSAEIVPHVD